MARQAGLPSVLFAREMLKYIVNNRRESIRGPELIKPQQKKTNNYNNINNAASLSSTTASSSEISTVALKNEVSACIKDPRYMHHFFFRIEYLAQK